MMTGAPPISNPDRLVGSAPLGVSHKRVSYG
jgi:hypothetical protein